MLTHGITGAVLLASGAAVAIYSAVARSRVAGRISLLLALALTIGWMVESWSRFYPRMTIDLIDPLAMLGIGAAWTGAALRLKAFPMFPLGLGLSTCGVGLCFSAPWSEAAYNTGVAVFWVALAGSILVKTILKYLSKIEVETAARNRPLCAKARSQRGVLGS